MRNKHGVHIITHRDGELIKYTWPGFYPVYYVVSDAEPGRIGSIDIVCNKCAGNEIDNIIAVEMNEENDSLFCGECSQQIESAYGND